jgi:hypothetical protein
VPLGAQKQCVWPPLRVEEACELVLVDEEDFSALIRERTDDLSRDFGAFTFVRRGEAPVEQYQGVGIVIGVRAEPGSVPARRPLRVRAPCLGATA